jgi:RNA polymerase sigma-70 factor (ECF subfamily)
MGAGFDSVLAAAQLGEAWALERLYNSVAPAVAGYMRVQDASDPDDLAGDVMYRALRNVGAFEGSEAKFRSWVFSIAHNRLVDDRRRRSREPLGGSSDVAESAVWSIGGDVEDEAMVRLSTERVKQACAALPRDQRDVLLLRLAAGLTLEETAATVGKSRGAVKALQHRAVAALRRQFDRAGVSR